ncbi:MAG: radical SAM protein [Thermodesulfobacteriota bacterium]
MPPFGVAFLSGMLKRVGVKSRLHDDNRIGLTDDQFRSLFLKHKAEIRAIGLTSITTTINQIRRLARLSKEVLPDVPVIVGGPHARLRPEDIIAFPEVDLVFTSEADLAVARFAKGEPLPDIPGLMYRENGGIRQNPVVEAIDINQLPFPDYDLFDIRDYRTTRGYGKRHPNSYLVTSRGCPYKCTFCASKSLNPTPDKSVRFRDPESVIAEIELLSGKYGVRELFFADDMFTGRDAHVFGICEGLIRLGADMIWVCMTHVNNVTEEKLRIMKRAGCHQVCFGVESGDPDIQKAINKNLELDRVRQVVRLARRAGLDVRCSFMFGNQNETPATMQRTLDFAQSLKLDFASLNIATPYPGTGLRAWAIENGYLANPDYEALDGTTYPIVTPELPPGTVEHYYEKAFKSFYFSPRYALRRLGRVRTREDMSRYLKSAALGLASLPAMLKKR